MINTQYILCWQLSSFLLKWIYKKIIKYVSFWFVSHFPQTILMSFGLYRQNNLWIIYIYRFFLAWWTLTCMFGWHSDFCVYLWANKLWVHENYFIFFYFLYYLFLYRLIQRFNIFWNWFCIGAGFAVLIIGN